MPHTPITHSEAVEIARRFATSKGWSWPDDDLHVGLSKGMLEVTTNASCLGGNLVIQIDPATGQVRGHVFYAE